MLTIAKLFILIFCFAFSISSQVKAQNLRALFFLSPDCPICNSYASTINKMCLDFEQKVNFYAIFPGKEYSELEIDKFYKKYDLKAILVLDLEKDSVKKYKASITPEVFLINNNKVIYSGAIDDLFADVGQKRAKSSHLYLRKNIESFLSNKPLPYRNSKAVGCFIE